MKAIIRTDNSIAFYSLIHFLKSLDFHVETKEENEHFGTSRKKLLAIIRNGGDGKSIVDPQEWQRETRKDRNLPFEK